jgi:hypothetical protein
MLGGFMKISEALNIIKAAIADFQGDTGPGRWEAKVWSTGHARRPALVYEYTDSDPAWWPMPGPEWEDADDPWKRWGGDQIIETIEAIGKGKLRCTDGMLDHCKMLYQDAAIFSAADDEFEKEDD